MPRRVNLMYKLSPLLQQPEYLEHPEQTCRVIVEYKGPVTDRIASIVSANHGKVYRQLKSIGSLVVEVPFASLPELVAMKQVRRVWHDAKVRSMLNIAVPTVGAQKVQESGYTGKGMTAAILDTGIYPHADLTEPENRIIGWQDFVNERSSPYDDNGHGTHVAGIVAGNGYSSRGKYKGMAPEANLVGVKVLDQNGEGATSDIIAAIEWCIANREQYQIKAINLSLGSIAQDSYRFDPLCRAATSAWRNGIVVSAAAGNGGPETMSITSPGINPNIITVGNLDDHRTLNRADDQINPSSSRGPTPDNYVKPDLLAPGTDIFSLKVRRGYRALTGTSMSAPMVTGAALQILEKWPTYQPDKVKNLIRQNARSLNLESDSQGSGVLDLEPIFTETTKASANIPINIAWKKTSPFVWLLLAPKLLEFLI